MNSFYSQCVSRAGDAARMLAIRSPFGKGGDSWSGDCATKKQMHLIRRANGVSEAMMPNNPSQRTRMKPRAAERTR